MSRGAILSLILASFVFLSIASVSAGENCSQTNTIVAGTIYIHGTNPTVFVPGANIHVVCHAAGGDIVRDTLSDGVGHYSVTFNTATDIYDCLTGDFVEVSADKNGMAGSNDGTVGVGFNLPSNSCKLHVNVEVINVPLVPEFGLIAGLTTILGAVGAFFVVRRKK